jgi:hypothetical protein
MLRTVVTPIAAPPRDVCDWRACTERPAFRVTQRDDTQGGEIGEELFFCAEHATLVETMAAEAEQRHRWRQGGGTTP